MKSVAIPVVSAAQESLSAGLRDFDEPDEGVVIDDICI